MKKLAAITGLLIVCLLAVVSCAKAPSFSSEGLDEGTIQAPMAPGVVGQAPPPTVVIPPAVDMPAR